MPPRKRNKTIHGVPVEQVELQGSWYTDVDNRVKIAERADPALIRREGAGYHVVSVQFVPLGDRWAYHCMVEYPAGSGIVKPGTDFIDTKDSSGVAKAETSAIGRALGLHGIAIEESIASANEMENHLQRQERHATPTERETPHAPRPVAAPAAAAAEPATQAGHGPAIEPDLQLATRDQQLELFRILLGNGVTFDDEAAGYLSQHLNRAVDASRLRAGKSDLTQSEFRHLLNVLGLGDPDDAPTPITRAASATTAQRGGVRA